MPKVVSGLRGFVLPDQNITKAAINWDSTTATQQNPSGPGLVTADSSGSGLVVGGALSSKMIFKATKGGSGHVTDGPRVSYTTGITPTIGHNAYNLIDSCSFGGEVELSPVGSPLRYAWDAVALRNGTILVAYAKSGATPAMTLATFNPVTQAFTDAFSFTEEPKDRIVALAQLSDGSALLVFQGDSYSLVVYRCRYPETDATDWALVSPAAGSSADPPGSYQMAARLVEFADKSLALYSFSKGSIKCYGSWDGGASFSEIWSDTSSINGEIDVIARDGIAYVFSANSDIASVRILESISATVSGAETYQIFDASATIQSSLHACFDDNGRCYIYTGTTVGTTYRFQAWSDDMRNWNTYTSLLFDTLPSTAPTNYAYYGRIVSALGYLVWVACAGDAIHDRLTMLRLGGHSDVTMRARNPAADLEVDRPSFGGDQCCAWIPVASPANLGWTVTSTATASYDTVGLKLVSTGAQAYSASQTVTVASTTWDGTIFLADFKVNSCPDGLGDRVYFYSAWDAGTRAGFVLSCNSSSWYLGAGDFLGSTSVSTGSLDNTVQRQYLLTANSSWIELWTRLPSAQEWTQLYSAANAAGYTFTTPPGANTVVNTFGVNSDIDVSIREFGNMALQSSATPGYKSLVSDYASASDSVVGRLISARPVGFPVTSTMSDASTQPVKVSVSGGRMQTSAQFTAYPDGEFGLSNLLWNSAQQTSKKWKSASFAQQNIVFSYPESRFRGRSFALVLAGCNFRNISVRTTDSSAAVTTIGTADLALGFTSLGFEKVGDFGNVLRPYGTGAATRYIWRNELAGAHICYTDGGTTYVRRIAWNSEGVWNATGGQKKCEIHLVPSGDGGETASIPANGTMDIWHHSGVLVIHGYDPEIDSDLEFRISSLSSYDFPSDELGFECGLMLFGAVQPCGREWGFNWSIAKNQNIQTSGTLGNMQRRQISRPVRELTVAWDDPLDQSFLRETVPSAGWLSPAEFEPLATWQDNPYLLSGILDELQGGVVPLVVLPKIPDYTTTINDPTLWLYGWIKSGINIENDWGAEGESELLRVSQLTIEEIV